MPKLSVALGWRAPRARSATSASSCAACGLATSLLHDQLQRPARSKASKLSEGISANEYRLAKDRALFSLTSDDAELDALNQDESCRWHRQSLPNSQSAICHPSTTTGRELSTSAGSSAARVQRCSRQVDVPDVRPVTCVWSIDLRDKFDARGGCYQAMRRADVASNAAESRASPAA